MAFIKQTFRVFGLILTVISVFLVPHYRNLYNVSLYLSMPNIHDFCLR